MKRLSKDLKQMLNALALQDVADYLPMSQKLDLLGVGSSKPSNARVTEPEALSPPPPRRVALLSNGVDISGVLRYALEQCRRQKATLDLVLYGKAKEEAEVDRLQASLEYCGVAHEVIMLGRESADALSEYLCLRRTLVYLVAPADDPLALKLTEELIPSRSGYTHLPIVLIDRNSPPLVNSNARIHAA